MFSDNLLVSWCKKKQTSAPLSALSASSRPDDVPPWQRWPLKLRDRKQHTKSFQVKGVALIFLAWFYSTRRTFRQNNIFKLKEEKQQQNKNKNSTPVKHSSIPAQAHTQGCREAFWCHSNTGRTSSVNMVSDHSIFLSFLLFCRGTVLLSAVWGPTSKLENWRPSWRSGDDNRLSFDCAR